jgi:hypothetical protein
MVLTYSTPVMGRMELGVMVMNLKRPLSINYAVMEWHIET